MPTLKIHLSSEEYAPISRMAYELKVRPEEIAYCGLDTVMKDIGSLAMQDSVRNVAAWRSSNLPIWSDSARSVHAYEGKPDVHSEPHI